MLSWDDNERPLAVLITFRTYGTWLHGDERGSIDRYNNRYRDPRHSANPVMKDQHAKRLKSKPVKLNGRQRATIRAAIKGVCKHRNWRLIAINIRTNHIHLVVAINAAKPESAVRDFKAYSTRALRGRQLWTESHSPWSEGGSCRYLWKETSVEAACQYVVNGQGVDLPDSF